MITRGHPIWTLGERHGSALAGRVSAAIWASSRQAEQRRLRLPGVVITAPYGG